jgi:hypothetical protein
MENWGMKGKKAQHKTEKNGKGETELLLLLTRV